MRMRVGRLGVSIALISLLGAPLTARAQPGESPTEEEWGGFRVGGDVGFATLELDEYFVLNVTGLVRLGPVRWDFWVPLRFNEEGFRTQDYDEPRDFTRIGRCIRVDAGDYTAPPDHFDPTCAPYRWAGHGLHDRVYFSARIHPLTGISLGHGTLMYQYRTSLDLERPQLGAHVDFSLYDWGGAEFILDDVTRPGVLGGRVFFRPQQVFFGENWDETPDELEIGFSALSDVWAPRHRITAFGRGLVDQDGDALFIRDQVTALSVDLHYMYLWNLGADRTEPLVGVFAYADYNHFLNVEDANALHAGARLVVKHEPTRFELRAGAEYRLIGNRYLPGYFDADYSIQSQRFGLTPEALAVPGVGIHTTQLEYMLQRPGGLGHGVQAYLSFTIPIPANNDTFNPLPITAFIEESTGEVNGAVFFGIGPFRMDQLVAMALYQRRNFDDFSQMFNPDGALLRVLGRIYLGSPDDPHGSWGEIMQYVHIDLRFDRRFFQTSQGEFAETNDLVVTAGVSAGSS